MASVQFSLCHVRMVMVPECQYLQLLVAPKHSRRNQRVVLGYGMDSEIGTAGQMDTWTREK